MFGLELGVKMSYVWTFRVTIDGLIVVWSTPLELELQMYSR